MCYSRYECRAHIAHSLFGGTININSNIRDKTHSTLVELVAQGGHLFSDVNEKPHNSGCGHHTCEHKSRCACTQQRPEEAATEKQTTPRGPAPAIAAVAAAILPTPIIILLISGL